MGVRELLQQLHLLRKELDEETATMNETAAQFDANLEKMKQQTERKKQRVRYLELQVRRIQDRQRPR